MTTLLLQLFLSITMLLPHAVISICELNLGLNKFNAFFGKGIYYNGEINSSFIENSPSQYNSSENNDVDYLYIAERVIENTGLTYEHIKIDIEAMNKTLMSPLVKYTLHSAISVEILSGEIEVVYNCKVGEVGESMIKMSFIPQSCAKFELRWLKQCNSTPQLTITSIPKVSIGLKAYDNIMKDGLVMNANVVNLTSAIVSPFIIKENTIVMYLSNTSPNESYTIQPIELNYPTTKDYSAQIRGGVSKGGLIPSNPTSLILEFFCMNTTIVDLEIVIPFQNNHLIKMYIRQHCENPALAIATAAVIARKGIIRRIFAFIHAYFLLLFICGVGAVIYYNIQDGELYINDICRRLGRFINEKLGYVYKKANMQYNPLNYGSDDDKRHDNYKDDEDNEMMNSIDEDDMVNITIQVGKNDTHSEKITSPNNSQENYGGI